MGGSATGGDKVRKRKNEKTNINTMYDLHQRRTVRGRPRQLRNSQSTEDCESYGHPEAAYKYVHLPLLIDSCAPGTVSV
jgi:hypothetical protein